MALRREVVDIVVEIELLLTLVRPRHSCGKLMIEQLPSQAELVWNPHYAGWVQLDQLLPLLPLELAHLIVLLQRQEVLLLLVKHQEGDLIEVEEGRQHSLTMPYHLVQGQLLQQLDRIGHELEELLPPQVDRLLHSEPVHPHCHRSHNDLHAQLLAQREVRVPSLSELT